MSPNSSMMSHLLHYINNNKINEKRLLSDPILGTQKTFPLSLPPGVVIETVVNQPCSLWIDGRRLLCIFYFLDQPLKYVKSLNKLKICNSFLKRANFKTRVFSLTYTKINFKFFSSKEVSSQEVIKLKKNLLFF